MQILNVKVVLSSMRFDKWYRYVVQSLFSTSNCSRDDFFQNRHFNYSSQSVVFEVSVVETGFPCIYLVLVNVTKIDQYILAACALAHKYCNIHLVRNCVIFYGLSQNISILNADLWLWCFLIIFTEKGIMLEFIACNFQHMVWL